MYFSLTFTDPENAENTVNTYEDWHIVPLSRPLVNPPEVKTEYIDIPGADGALDYTGILAGIKYKNREGSWSFVVLNDYQEWHVLYGKIITFLHGKRMKVHLESDPDYYYYGRFFVESWKSEKDWSKVAIKYIIDPYKFPVNTTSEYDWLWDDLFDLTIYYGTFDVDGTKARNLINPMDIDVVPVFSCTTDMSVEFDGISYALPAGDTSGLILKPGDNFMTFSGNGRVVVDYDTGRTL